MGNYHTDNAGCDTKCRPVIGPEERADMAAKLFDAQAETGFKLNERVITVHGERKVVGFTRINLPRIKDPVRCVIVADPHRLDTEGPEAAEVYHPSSIAGI